MSWYKNVPRSYDEEAVDLLGYFPPARSPHLSVCFQQHYTSQSPLGLVVHGHLSLHIERDMKLVE